MDDRVLAHRVMEMELDVLKTLWWVAFGWYSSLVLPSIGDGAPDECLIDAALQRDAPEMALYVIRVTRTARELLQSPKFYWDGALEKILEVAYTKALGDEASGAEGWRPAGVGPRLPLESAGLAAPDEAGQFVTPASGPLSVAGDSAQGVLQGDGSAERSGDGVLAGNQSRGGPVLEGSTASSMGAGPALAPRVLEPSLKGAGGALVAGVAAQGQGAASPVNSVSEGGVPRAAVAASWGMPSNMSAGTMPAAEGSTSVWAPALMAAAAVIGWSSSSDANTGTPSATGNPFSNVAPTPVAEQGVMSGDRLGRERADVSAVDMGKPASAGGAQAACQGELKLLGLAGNAAVVVQEAAPPAQETTDIRMMESSSVVKT